MNDLQDDGIILFSHYLKYLNNLKELNISNNYIRSNGIKEFSNQLIYITKIKLLDISRIIN